MSHSCCLLLNSSLEPPSLHWHNLTPPATHFRCQAETFSWRLFKTIYLFWVDVGEKKCRKCLFSLPHNSYFSDSFCPLRLFTWVSMSISPSKLLNISSISSHVCSIWKRNHPPDEESAQVHLKASNGQTQRICSILLVCSKGTSNYCSQLAEVFICSLELTTNRLQPQSCGCLNTYLDPRLSRSSNHLLVLFPSHRKSLVNES